MSSSSPRHSPPPSAAAPRPKGILKNASAGGLERQGSAVAPQDAQSPPVDEHGNRLAWDETNLTLHEIERENTAARMKIDEPKTPFVRSASLGSVDALDLDNEHNYFEGSGGGDSSSSGGGQNSLPEGTSAADLLAANTSANAGPGGRAGSAGLAVGLDAADVSTLSTRRGSGAESVLSTGENPSPAGRATSRSPSFSLPPSSRRSSSSSARNNDRGAVRDEARGRGADDMDTRPDETLDDEDDEDLDPEEKANRAAFAQKRHQHYGNEAQAMKLAAALAAQEDDDDDDENEGDGSSGGPSRTIPPVPPLPNSVH
ncbi:hypothetical protein IE81DRAFT_329065 [Ceraceosorus guamensis]|uniref:Uncharacterized protein n=1 Tax=Ceraceosorus guamensis TaxID=1522189 RepID=A0A316W319_9BASI|nr:hypothetical protein IE81DRAFT_329065 [Ceraceosorus guamensis]PWN44089.1 hypothetical protein IE81DRAFT_329065 [Ceraceosorus guamensis]